MLGLLFRLEQKRQLMRQKILERQILRVNSAGSSHFAVIAGALALASLVPMIAPITAPVSAALAVVAGLLALTIVFLPIAGVL